MVLLSDVAVQSIATIGLSIIVAAACFAFSFTNQRRKMKKPVYMIGGFGFVSTAISCLATLIIPGFYPIWANWLSYANLVWLTLLILGLLYTDWRIDDHT